MNEAETHAAERVTRLEARVRRLEAERDELRVQLAALRRRHNATKNAAFGQLFGTRVIFGPDGEDLNG